MALSEYFLKIMKTITFIDNFGEEVERFQIEQINAYITQLETGKFKCWIGGCSVGVDRKDLNDARKYIFDYIKESLQRQHAIAKRTAELTHLLYSRLGDDVFNLGQFKLTTQHTIPREGVPPR
jgi:hypothetical protein